MLYTEGFGMRHYVGFLQIGSQIYNCSEASGTNGWGAYWSGKWLQGQWSEAQTTDGYNMERTICYCYGCLHLGSALAEAEDLNSL